MKGYYGVTCKSVCNKYRYKLNCVSSCPTGTFVNEDIKVCLGCPYVYFNILIIRVVNHAL